LYHCVTYKLHDLGVFASVVDTVAGTLVAFAVAVVVVFVVVVVVVVAAAAAAVVVVLDVVVGGKDFAPSTYKVYYKYLNTT